MYMGKAYHPVWLDNLAVDARESAAMQAKLEDINGTVGKVAEIVSEIASTAREESTGID